MTPATTNTALKTALIHSDAWTRFDYGPQHPLRMERLGLTWRLMEAYGLTALPGVVVRAPEPAPESALAVYHGAEYLQMLKATNEVRRPSSPSASALDPGTIPCSPGSGMLRGSAPPARSWRPTSSQADRRIACSTSPEACTTPCPHARRASVTSTTRCWRFSGCASRGCASSTSTSTRITATACSTRSTVIRP